MEELDSERLCPDGVPNRTIEVEEYLRMDEQESDNKRKFLQGPQSSVEMSDNESELLSPTPSEIQARAQEGIDLISVPYVTPEVWCTIIYYEMGTRVGDPFHAVKPSVIVDGFTSPTDEDRLCVGMLNNIHRTQAIVDCRKAIGLFLFSGLVYVFLFRPWM